MIVFIWMLTWLPQVLPAMRGLPQPVDLTLTSDHFIHVLKWSSEPGAPTGVYYRVDIHSERGSSWEPVAGCQRVRHPLVCNLTEAFSNPQETYFTQVTAQLEEQTSQSSAYERFLPINETRLDLPLLTVTPCGRNLCVDFRLRMEHLRTRYNLLEYELRITSNDGQFFEEIKSTLSGKTLEKLAPGKQYCVSVRISDDLISRKSNYGQPQCASTHGVYTADTLISGVLCFLVLSGVVALGLWVYTCLICWKWRPLPAVLTSIHHIEEVRVLTPCSTDLSSLSNVKATLPSSGGKRNSQTSSDDSDGESETDTTAGSTNVGYKLRLGTNLLSASSSSSSSTSAPLSPEAVVPPSSPSNPNAVFLPPDFFSPQPEAPISAAGLNHTRTDSLPDSLPESLQSPPADTDSSTVERTELKEEVEAGDGSGQAVNLLTLTFGRREDKEEEKEEEEEEEGKSHLDISEVEPESPSAALILPSQTVETEEVAIETISCSVVEEEEEEEDAELCGYMRRPVS